MVENNHYQEQAVNPEKPLPSAWVIFDLDGVLIRWPQYDLPLEKEQAEFFSSLQQLHESNVALSVLTNRSPAAMQILAYQCGVKDGLWVTESGGSVYSVTDHKAWVLPEWIDFAQNNIPESRRYLEETLKITGQNLIPLSNNEAQFEPGMGLVKTVVVPPRGISSKEYFTKTFSPAWSNFSRASHFKVEVGKAIDIDPKNLSKAAGMAHLLNLNGINPQITPTLFIADAARDISAADMLLEMGGYVGAVGNSALDFKKAVSRQTNGIIAPTNTSYHGSVTNIFSQFFK